MKKVIFSFFVCSLLFSSCASDTNFSESEESLTSRPDGQSSSLVDQEAARKNADQTYLNMTEAQFETFFSNSRNGIVDAIYKTEKRLSDLESELKDLEKITAGSDTQKAKATRKRIQSEKERIVNLNKRLNNFDNHIKKFENYAVEDRPMFMEELRTLLKN
jgi:peptidoglycan hydrolase CwlO-like protein